MSGPAKCPLARTPKIFLGLRGAHLRGGAWCGARVGWGSQPGCWEFRGGDSAGVSPSLRAVVRAVLDGPRRQAPHSVTTPRLSDHLRPLRELGPPSPTPPAVRSRPSRVGRARQLGEGPGMQTEKCLHGIPGWKMCRLHCPTNCRGLSTGIAPPGVLTRHRGALFRPGPLALAEQRTPLQARRSILPSSPAPLSPHPTRFPGGSPQWSPRPFPFPRSLFLVPRAVLLPSISSDPSHIFCVSPFLSLSALGSGNLWSLL